MHNASDPIIAAIDAAVQDDRHSTEAIIEELEEAVEHAEMWIDILRADLKRREGGGEKKAAERLP